jgi:hypothetical protein
VTVNDDEFLLFNETTQFRGGLGRGQIFQAQDFRPAEFCKDYGFQSELGVIFKDRRWANEQTGPEAPAIVTIDPTT